MSKILGFAAKARAIQASFAQKARCDRKLINLIEFKHRRSPIG
ncbi:hypothetical protein [Nostoc sp.]